MEQFYMNTRVYMGQASLDKIIELGIGRAYIICDPFMKQSGKADEIGERLKKSGADFEIFSEVVPDPTITVIANGIAGMNVFRPDAVIALGGGSAIDTAKAVAHLYGTMRSENRPYLVAVPTTSGTGSEVTCFSVITDSRNQTKYALRDPSLIPDAAILDPGLTTTVPAHITADTGMDVLTHGIEAYVSTRANDLSDACAEKAIRMVWEFLERAVANGADITVRERMHNASCLAGIAFNGASLGLCHSLAHALGARFHLAHGCANAILLPHVIAYNAGLELEDGTVALKRYVEIANMLGISAGTDKATVHGLIRQLRNLMGRIGISGQIAELGIGKDEFLNAIPEMAEKAAADVCTETNPRIPEPADFEDIYKRLWKGGLHTTSPC